MVNVTGRLRFLSIPARASEEYFVFENIHEYPTAKAFAEALKQNSSKYYGTAGPTFVERIVREFDYSCEFVRRGMREFIVDQTNAHNINNERVLRVLDTFALIGAAGELAT